MKEKKDQYKTCKNCGREMTRGKNDRRETCSNACRQAYYRKQKAQGKSNSVTSA